MPEHLRALVYILVIASAVFWIAERPLTARAMTVPDYRRRRNLWFALTLIAFLSFSFWLYLLLAGVLLAVMARRDRNPMALYLSLLFVIPYFSVQVPGLGLINYLVELSHVRLLSLFILLPAAVALLYERRPASDLPRAADWLFGAYLVHMVLMQATVDSLTGLMRLVFGLMLDLWLPYYVATRSLRTMGQLLEVLAAFVLALAVMGPIGLFETGRGWLLYETLRAPLGLPPPDIGIYIIRATEEGGGFLRANATAGNAIAFGFLALVATCWLLVVARDFKPRVRGWAVVGCVLIGLAASLSRGPWTAALIALLIGISMGPGAARRLGWTAAAGAVGVALMLTTQQGQAFIDYLPFVGTVEPGSVTYRQRLFEQSMLVFWQNPIFGSFSYIFNPALESMRQGQGLIDMVNSYLAVALAYGLIGLVFFTAPFAYALLTCWVTRRRLATIDLGSEALGRALCASLIGILIVIAAVSSILHIPTVYWIVFGLCVSYAKIGEAVLRGVAEARRATVLAPGRGRPDPRAGVGPRGTAASPRRGQAAVGRGRV